MRLSSGGCFIDRIAAWLTAWGYRRIEVPTLVPSAMFRSCVEGTDNRMFDLGGGVSLLPEVTNYVRAVGRERLGAEQVYYVARCFRDESTTDAERLREFTQIGVECLSERALDSRKVVRRDAIRLFASLLPSEAWSLDDGVTRGLNLYDSSAADRMTAARAGRWGWSGSSWHFRRASPSPWDAGGRGGPARL
jgi:hypothetical protein